MAKPTLALIPASQGSKLFSVLPSSGVGDFDFSRGSAATRINSQGLIETVVSGQSRLDYHLIDGKVVGCPHHILEPQRLQKIQYSEDFSQWSSNGGGVTSNQTISPDGSLTADKLFAITNNGQHRLDFTSSNVAGATTFSFFTKSAEYNSVWARIGSSSVYFNLENGESFNDTTATTSSVEYYGNGWYRCTLTKEVSSANEVCRINLTQSYKDFSAWTGDGTSGFYVWGAQHEVGSYPTSYIPNYGTSAGVTRAAETANGAGDASTFNDSEGVLMFEGSTLVNDNTNRQISISNGTNSNAIKFTFIDEDTLIFERKTSSGDTQDSIDFVSGNFTKIAFQYKSNNYKAFANGFEITLTQSVNLPTSLSVLNFDNGAGGADFYGKTKQIQYFQTALTDSELEELTSWDSFGAMAIGQLYTIK